MNLMCEIWSRKPQMLRTVARWHSYKTSCSRCVFMAWLTYREVLVVESQAARPTSWQTQFESVFSTCLCVKPLDVFRPRHKTRCPDVFLILTMWLLWLNRNTASWQKKHWRFKQKRNTEVRLICGSPGSDFANMYSGHRCLALIRVVQQSAEAEVVSDYKQLSWGALVHIILSNGGGWWSNTALFVPAGHANVGEALLYPT